MTNDELRARFDERRPDNEDTDVSDNTDDSNNSRNTGDADSTKNTEDASSTPGPDADPDSTRNRKQVPMYLSEHRADALNGLYERLDGRSKVAGEGGIEKHADFMAEVADLAIENEDELARRLGIETESGA